MKYIIAGLVLWFVLNVTVFIVLVRAALKYDPHRSTPKEPEPEWCGDPDVDANDE